MTSTQARALDIARRDGLTVVGHGTRKADGRSVYLVPSRSQANRLYVVANEGTHLSCDCPAGKVGKVCAHRAAVHEYLAAGLRAAMEAAPLLRDNRPITIWK